MDTILLTPTQVANYLQINHNVLTYWDKKGWLIPVARNPRRYYFSDVERMKTERKQYGKMH